MKNATIISLVLMVLIFSKCNFEDEQVLLKLKYEPDTKIIYNITGNQLQKVIIADTVNSVSKSKSELLSMITLDSLVNDTVYYITDSSFWLEFRSNTEDSSVIDTFEFNRKFTMKILPNGKILSFNDDNLSQDGYFTYMKDLYEQSTMRLPDDFVSPGYQWEQITSIPLDQDTIDAKTRYKVISFVKESNSDCVLIEYSSESIIPFSIKENDSTKYSGMDRVTADGTIYFDYNEGFFVRQLDHWLFDGDRLRIINNDSCKFKLLREYSTLTLGTQNKSSE